MSYQLIYRPRRNVVPIINNIAYDTSEITNNILIGIFDDKSEARYWVSRHLRFGTLYKSEEAIARDSFISGWGAANNPTDPFPRPVPPQGLTGVQKIKLGPWHGIAVLYNNEVIGWGSNAYGQINQTALNQLNGSQIKKIEVGERHTLFLFNNGSILGIGGNNASNGNYLTNVKDISSGPYFSLALFEDGNVTGWGGVSAGNAVNVPDFLKTGGATTKISAGGTHGLALINAEFIPFSDYPEYVENKTLLTGWGDYQNFNTQASNLLTGQFKESVGYAGLVDISAGMWHSLAIIEKWVQRSPTSIYYDKVRVVTGWGINNPPVENGVGPNINLANGGDNLLYVKNIYAAPYHNIAEFSNGEITGWGRLNAYQNLNYKTGIITSLSVNYDYNVAIRQISRPASWEGADVVSNWPFNDLYFVDDCGGGGGSIDLVPC